MKIFFLPNASHYVFVFVKALSGFEYVEPNGKDVGINVRKKAETILTLLNDKQKIQAARDKAAATRDKYDSEHSL